MPAKRPRATPVADSGADRTDPPGTSAHAPHGYNAALDGLRALAVLAVLAFHVSIYTPHI